MPGIVKCKSAWAQAHKNAALHTLRHEAPRALLAATGFRLRVSTYPQFQSLSPPPPEPPPSSHEEVSETPKSLPPMSFELSGMLWKGA